MKMLAALTCVLGLMACDKGSTGPVEKTKQEAPQDPRCDAALTPQGLEKVCGAGIVLTPTRLEGKSKVCDRRGGGIEFSVSESRYKKKSMAGKQGPLNKSTRTHFVALAAAGDLTVEVKSPKSSDCGSLENMMTLARSAATAFR